MSSWESTIILSVLSWLDSEFTCVFLFLALLLLNCLSQSRVFLISTASPVWSFCPYCPLFFNHILFQKDFQGYHMSFSMKPYIYWWFIRSLCFSSSFFPLLPSCVDLKTAHYGIYCPPLSDRKKASLSLWASVFQNMNWNSLCSTKCKTLDKKNKDSTWQSNDANVGFDEGNKLSVKMGAHKDVSGQLYS